MISIERLAMRWIEARVEKERLRDERNATLCVHEKIVTHHAPGDARFGIRGSSWDFREGDACWKGRHEDDGEGNSAFVTNRDRDDGEWCERCIERDRLNTEFKAARARQTARMGALTRACRREHAALASQGLRAEKSDG